MSASAYIYIYIYHSTAHSFILCMDDPIWKKAFTKEEYEEIRTHRSLTLPDIDEEVSALFDTLEKKADEIMGSSGGDEDEVADKLLNALSDLVMEMGPYDYRTEYNLYWIHSALTQMLSYYKFGVVRRMLQNSSEMDFVSLLWSIFDRCFHDIHVLPGRDRSCQATSLRVNKDRSITGTNNIDGKISVARPDLLLIKDGFEYGCSEVSKSMDLVPTKKEIVETGLHNPKTMKDLFDRMTNEAEHDLEFARKLQIVCFNNTGKKPPLCIHLKYSFTKPKLPIIGCRMKLCVMDCPGGYVCRVQETDEYKISTKIQSLVSEVIPMLILTLQAKTIVRNMTALLLSYKTKGKGRPEFKVTRDARNSAKNRIMLPSALTTFASTTTTRKRKNDEVD
ncbi:hypothetical protein BJV82DRAFT_358550 [Fennellomyces sp. T-0311]|nr:hypothetical protein BJV82DRAFT_358550 [Fennellomyces sp. T-0311]